MNRVIRLCLTLALVVGLQAAYPAQRRCELPLMGHVEAQVGDGGQLLLSGSVNGHEVWFELRTFDGFSLMREAAVTAIGLTATELPTTTSGASRIATPALHATTGGKAIGGYVRVTGMKLGRITVPGFEALIVPAGSSDGLPYYRDRPVVGTIGGQLLSVTDVEINLAENRVSFFRQSDCKDDPVYWDGEITILPVYFDPTGSLLFPMELDGQKVETSLVGGTRESRIDESVTRKYFGFDSTSPGIEKRSAAGREDASFKAMSLTAEGLNIRNTPVLLKAGTGCRLTSRTPGARAIGYTNCMSTVPLSLGTDLLKQLRIYIASKKGKIYISKAAVAAPRP